MSFIQIIEYEIDRPDEMRAPGGWFAPGQTEPPPGFRHTTTKDRERPIR